MYREETFPRGEKLGWGVRVEMSNKGPLGIHSCDSHPPPSFGTGPRLGKSELPQKSSTIRQSGVTVDRGIWAGRACLILEARMLLLPRTNTDFGFSFVRL